MKITKKILNITYFLITITIKLNADNRILFYLQKIPNLAINEVRQTLSNEYAIKKIVKLNAKTPGQQSEKLLKNELKRYLPKTLSGYISLYGGYIDFSNTDGLISFPLRHSAAKLYLVVTKQIKLVKIKGNTISHQEFKQKKQLEIVKNIPVKIYLFEKKQDKNKQYFWQVKEYDRPKNNRINPLSVILLTNPQNIYVYTGDFISNDNKSLVLPNNIFAVGKINNVKAALNFINIYRFFEPTETEEKKANDQLYEYLITNN